MKLLAIFQKFGRDDNIISERFFTISKMACQSGSREDFAAHNKFIIWREEKIQENNSPTDASGCLASSASIAFCSSIVSSTLEPSGSFTGDEFSTDTEMVIRNISLQLHVDSDRT
jgi:hypothetical protein